MARIDELIEELESCEDSRELSRKSILRLAKLSKDEYDNEKFTADNMLRDFMYHSLRVLEYGFKVTQKTWESNLTFVAAMMQLRKMDIKGEVKNIRALIEESKKNNMEDYG